MSNHYLQQCYLSFDCILWIKYIDEIWLRRDIFHDRECIWKCLKIGRHFVSALMCLSKATGKTTVSAVKRGLSSYCTLHNMCFLCCGYIIFFMEFMWYAYIHVSLGQYKKDVTPLRYSFHGIHVIHIHLSMGQCKKDVTPLLTHWSYVLCALAHRFEMVSSLELGCDIIASVPVK